MATYECDSGFTLVGNQVKTCQDDRNWSETEPMGTGGKQIQFALYREFVFKLQQQETTCFVVYKLLWFMCISVIIHMFSYILMECNFYVEFLTNDCVKLFHFTK